MTSKIKLTFLGTADAIPSANRNHTAILLSYNEENILVDCGEGTQRQFRKAGLNPCKLTRILITHWHGDHVLGIPGLLQTLALSGFNKKLFIYGPSGTKKFVREMVNLFGFSNEFEIQVEEVSGNSGKFIDTPDFYVEAKSMEHGIPTNAYAFVEKGKLRIDKNKLKKSKLPNGPLLQKLKEGKDFSYEGKKYKSKDFTYEEKERRISIVLDTRLNPGIVPFVKDSEILVLESSFSEELEDKAKEHLHLTSRQAGEIAKKGKVKKLILTHLSQRYENQRKKIKSEVKKVFDNFELVKDLDVVELK